MVGSPARLSALQPNMHSTLICEWSMPEKWPNSCTNAASNSAGVSSKLEALSMPSWKMPFMTAMPETISPAPLAAQGPAKPMTDGSSPRSSNSEPSWSKMIGLWSPSRQLPSTELYSTAVLTLPSATPWIAPARL